MQAPSEVALIIFALLLCIAAFLFQRYTSRSKYITKCKKALEVRTADEQIALMQEEQNVTKEKINQGKHHHRKLMRLISEAEAKTSQIGVGLQPPVFRYDDRESLKTKIADCRQLQYECILRGDAATSFSDWTFFGSRTNGDKMVADYKLLLVKAFNAEFEVIRRQMRIRTIDTAQNKLERLDTQLEKLGETAKVCISSEYLNLKHAELMVWADELNHKEELKEERKRQREQLKAAKAQEGEDIEKIDEDLAAHESELAKARKKAEALVGAERSKLERQIERICKERDALEDKLSRAVSQAQITRSGYIYVISNIGSFGEGVVKIGMTRRLEPMDRVNELGDASVPFKFDVHTLAFVENAPTVEKALHNEFSQYRVNTENHRKEFFRVEPKAVKLAFEKMNIESDWFLDVSAKEYRESEMIRAAAQQIRETVTSSSRLPEAI